MSDPKIVRTVTHYDQTSAARRTSRESRSSTGTASSQSSQEATGERQETQRQFANVGFTMAFKVRIRGGKPTESTTTC